MTIQNYIEFIKKIELFKELSEEELTSVAQIITEKRIKANKSVFIENAERNHIYLIFAGEVELFKKTPFGAEKKLSYFRELDFLGEGSIIDNSPHSTNARTISDTHLLMISASELKNIMKQNGEIAIKILPQIAKVISRRISGVNNQMVNIASQYISGKTRVEHDLLGDRNVSSDVYYGVQTLRALENFNITGVNLSFYPLFIQSLAMVKWAAAKANNELGLLSDEITDAITQACEDIIHGKHHKEFVVDMLQGGAGTSTNMNANEVIANKALEILGHERGQYEYCHPNNHVNLSQSTNDAYPTSVKIALINSNKKLVTVLMDLISSMRQKGEEFFDVIKMGRTQLQDAVPMILGQSFEAYAVTLEEEIQRLNQNSALFLEVNMGATAIGTGINSEPGYSTKVIKYLREITGMDIVLALNLIEATQDTSSFIMYSSAIKRLAIKLSKISNDLRLLSSGPRTGFNEINLPEMQPGSSIMPGKVNPVIPEVVNQIAFKVIGNDLTVSLAVEAGQLELNVMEPVIVQSLFENIEMLKNGMATLNYRCIIGITANKEHCRRLVMNSIGLVTALNPIIGYEASTAVAKEAKESGRGVYDIVLEKGLLSKEELDEVLKPENMIRPMKFKRKA